LASQISLAMSTEKSGMDAQQARIDKGPVNDIE
jgi:hypothetical protein